MAKYKMSTITHISAQRNAAELDCGHVVIRSFAEEWWTEGVRCKCDVCSAAAATGAATTATAAIVPVEKPLTHAVPRVSLRVVREDVLVDDYPQVRTPTDVYTLFSREIADLDHEVMIVAALDVKNRVIGTYYAARGSTDYSTVSLKEVFKTALMLNAKSIIVGHNHPSGDPTPSWADTRVTESMVAAGELLEVDVMDHIVIGDGRYVSMKERKLGFK